MLQVRMKVTDGYPGWAGRLIERGVKALHRPAAFGRTEWIFKKDGEAIKVVEGCGTSVTTKIESPTAKQCEIAKELESIGVAVVVC